MSVGNTNEVNRERWVQNVLSSIPAGSRILDAGAGEQKYKPFCAHLKYVSQDFARYNGKGDGSGFQTGSWEQGKLDIVSDIAAIPEPDNSFDAVMCIEVLEHVPNPVSAIKEFSRLIRKGGCLILTAPFCSMTHFAPYHFFTGFSRYFYEKYLSGHGFTIVEMRPNGNFFEYLAQEIRRIPYVAERYTRGAWNIMTRIALVIIVRAMLVILGLLSRRDKGSQDILCFGYHILARKI